jgi:hypothetical protein
MLARGVGGLEVAMAIADEPLYILWGTSLVKLIFAVGCKVGCGGPGK